MWYVSVEDEVCESEVCEVWRVRCEGEVWRMRCGG